MFGHIRRWLRRRFSPPLEWIDEDALIRGARRLRDDKRKQGQQVDVDYLTYGIATYYSRIVIDQTWARRVFFYLEKAVPKALRPGRAFMRAESQDGLEAYRHQQRVLQTAEFVFTLRKVDGLDDRIRALRSVQVESTFAELAAGFFLATRGIAFRYVRPAGRAGADYDIDVLPDGSAIVPCEVECKTESGTPSEATVRRTLDHARRQLTKGVQGMIFLKVPESWTSAPEGTASLVAGLQHLFRNTTRVAVVVIPWDVVRVLPVGGAACYSMHRVEANQRVSIQPPLSRLITMLSGPTIPYTSLRAVAERAAREA